VSDLEARFWHWWRALGGPALVSEHRFAPPRRWRFDFAAPEALVAVELEGGIYSGGRHVRGSGFEADCAKYNAAALAGWAVFRLTGRMLDRDPAGQLGPIMEAIARRSGDGKG
jgi:hypothetical protein